MRWSKPRRITAQSRGETAVEENRVRVQCAFCKGTGRDPFGLSHLSNCVACGGKGTKLVAEPYETCGACEGTGHFYRSHMYCWTCRGKGVVPAEEQMAEPTAGGEPVAY